MDREYYKQRMTNYIRLSGYSIHTLEGWFTGTWKVENGVPETVVADSLGHSSVRTLHKHYLIHSPTYLKSIISPL